MNKINKPDCYSCIHRDTVIGSAHSSCTHPDTEINKKEYVVSTLGALAKGKEVSLVMPNNLGIVGNEHGIKNGWFLWPLNFDPTWLEACNGYEKKEGTDERK